MKIIERIKASEAAGKKFFSFEYFPPKTEAGLQNLYARIDRMIGMEPAFVDVTWGAGGSTADQTLLMAQNIQRFFGIDVLMHLTCSGMNKKQIRDVLQRAKDAGIRNILALRGDGYVAGKGSKDFRFASDLVKFIKDEFQDDFGVAVASYPEGHPMDKKKSDSIKHLKTKVDAGADFTITQLFYDLDEYREFLKMCRNEGIDCPILPGIMPISNFQRFSRFVEFCNLKVPTHIQNLLEPIKDNDELVLAQGIEIAASMCKTLMEEGVNGFHFYTLNLETSTTQTLQNLGMLDETRERKALPWRPSALDSRRNEEVRPIFWSNRPKSYVARTMTWDDFPNGRWGSSFSPTYGDLTDYYLFRRIHEPDVLDLRRKQWGEPKTFEDVGNIFVKFCTGKIDRLPWCEMPIQSETMRIADDIVALNKNGFWTINSQPQINGANSADPEVGWGGPGGYVYQKAYIEFFTTKDRLQTLVSRMKDFPSLSYQAVNVRGDVEASFQERFLSAVTWGVFPGKEIVQPTVVDSDSFMIWRQEAFQLWFDEWRVLYDEKSPSYELLTKLNEELYLVNIVEHDYVNGNIFKVFS